ncbi:conserved Plasmodium protein, unknown function [Plasmodium ovale]|uniref:Uncharacterized protein n=1 Tax=Plasmodium ovale TaxID=36330 RepID=A0A1C3KRC7_PLAOA|nr:conserved Plasmodium protein, unknown function [Plasmodium ovale]
MAAFKPYKFIIFDKNWRNSNFYTQVINYLNLSILCKEIYVSDKYGKLTYEQICKDKIRYFSDRDLFYKLKKNETYQKGKEGQKKFSIKGNAIMGNSNYMANTPPGSHKKEEFHENEQNLCENKSTEVNAELISEENPIWGKRNLVGLFTYEEGKKKEFLNTLNLCKIYKVDHMNILCLNGHNSIQDIFKGYHFKNRISLFCPFYVIHSDQQNGEKHDFDKYSKSIICRIKDFLYTIISDFLPLNYKHIYLSDLVRAIILNSELCERNAGENKEVEILKFIDMMQIIGKL